MNVSLDGWDITSADGVGWIPWGSGNARAKILGAADGYHVVLVDADAGYAAEAHEHEFTEFLYVIDGSLRAPHRRRRPMSS